MSLTKATYSMIKGATANVLDFGAIGNGVADDSAAIQAAVDFISASGIGGEVFFPKGKYKIDNAIDVPVIINDVSGIHFVGVGWGSSIQAGAATDRLFSVPCRAVTFSFMYFVNTSGLTNTAITSGGNSGSQPGVSIDNCSFVGFTNGIGLSYTNHQIINNFFLNNTCHISFVDDGRNSYVFGNNFLGGTIGIRFRQAGANAEGVRIINNNIQITGANGASIDATGALEMTIMGNIIDQTGPNSIAIYLHGDGTFVIDRIKVIGNWIAAGQNSYGMFVNGPNSNIECTNNSFVSNNLLTTVAGLSLTDTDTYQLIGNNFLMTGGTDFGFLNAINGTIFGNSSNVSPSNTLSNKTPHTIAIGPTNTSIMGGGGAPTNTQPVGSLFLRSDAGVGSRLYVSQGAGVWLAVPGV